MRHRLEFRLLRRSDPARLRNRKFSAPGVETRTWNLGATRHVRYRMTTLAHHLSTHDGVITLAQARALGLSRHSVQRRLSAGTWVREAVGTFRAVDHPRTSRVRVRIAVASVGKSAVLVGSSAAWWHGITSAFPSKITVATQVKGRHAGASAGVLVTHRRLHEPDVVVVDGLRVASAATALLDIAADGDTSTVDNALLTRRVTITELDDALSRYPRRRGAPEARRLFDALRSGARSEAERTATALFDAHGITGWTANTEVLGYLLDFVFREARLVVEIDGFAFHRDAKAFQRDRTKRNALLADGWRVLNFTWDDITRRPDATAHQILDALEVSAA